MATGKNFGRGAAPTPAVVGIGRSMRARDVSRPRSENKPRSKTSDEPEQQDGQEAGSGSGGSSPVDS
jgi:hypothetical protein